MMKPSIALALAWASIAAAQEPLGLVQALASQNESLSTLNSLLLSQPAIASALAGASNITILAPKNNALSKLLNNSQAANSLAQDPGLLAALLSYHVLNGTYYASNFTRASKFIPTLLSNETYANITGGQRVQALLDNDKVLLYSALKENSTVVSANVNFTGGTIHIIDTVLSVPKNITETLQAANLTSASGAIRQAGVGGVLSQARDLTIFAPSNAAFNNIGSITGTLTSEQLGGLLNYHVVPGVVGYSDLLGNTTLRTASGQEVTIRNFNGTLFVNSAKVIIQDVFVSNGVVHVIDNVLNPANATVVPNPTASNPPVFSGATTGTAGVPFTSGIPAPTSTAPVGTGANPGGVASTSTSTQMAPAMRTGAVGAAALFGGAAMFMNF